MSYRPDKEQLDGLSYEVAECYGKPHIMAHYHGRGVKTHRKDSDAVCAICRRKVGSVHHNPPLSKGHVFVLRTPIGQFVLKPSLFSLCGSGTTGCHDGFHGDARYEPRWIWDDDEYAEKWWSGWFLSHFIEPHDEKLYRYGRWVIRDSKTGQDIEYRKTI